MNHFASPDFWFHYRQLPPETRDLADKNFELLKQNLRHPSLRLKKVDIFYSARVGLHYRVLAGVEMFSRVFARRAVAAANMPTFKALAQLNPTQSFVQAGLTNWIFWLGAELNRFDMGA